jgi:hypothetical protein
MKHEILEFSNMFFQNIINQEKNNFMCVCACACVYVCMYVCMYVLRDMGTHGSPPVRVPEVPVKCTRPAISPADQQVGPETLSTTPAILEDSRRPYPDPSTKLFPRSRRGAASRSVDRGIHTVIMEDDLPNL